MLWALKRLSHPKNLTLERIYFGFFGNNVPLDLQTVPIFCIYMAGRKWIQHTMGLGNNTSSGILHRYQKLFSSIEFSRETLFLECLCVRTRARRRSAHAYRAQRTALGLLLGLTSILFWKQWLSLVRGAHRLSETGLWENSRHPPGARVTCVLPHCFDFWKLNWLARKHFPDWTVFSTCSQNVFLTKVSSLPTVRKSCRP